MVAGAGSRWVFPTLWHHEHGQPPRQPRSSLRAHLHVATHLLLASSPVLGHLPEGSGRGYLTIVPQSMG